MVRDLLIKISDISMEVPTSQLLMVQELPVFQELETGFWLQNLIWICVDKLKTNGGSQWLEDIAFMENFWPNFQNLDFSPR